MARYAVIENGQVVNIVVGHPTAGYPNGVPLPADDDTVIIGCNVVGGVIKPPTYEKDADGNDLPRIVFNEVNIAEYGDKPEPVEEVELAPIAGVASAPPLTIEPRPPAPIPAEPEPEPVI